MYGIFEPVTDVPTYQSGFSQHMTAYQMMCNYMRSWALEATLDSVLSTLDRRIGWEVSVCMEQIHSEARPVAVSLCNIDRRLGWEVSACIEQIHGEAKAATLCEYHLKRSVKASHGSTVCTRCVQRGWTEESV